MNGADYVIIAIIIAYVVLECSRHRAVTRIAELMAEQEKRDPPTARAEE